ncbi:MAG: DUF4342 domain-containing protein [Actinomycetota bacterium]
MNASDDRLEEPVGRREQSFTEEKLPVTTIQGEPFPTSKEFPKEGKGTVEEFQISGDTLVAQVKELLYQGNIRRIIIKNEEGQTLIEIPLTVGVLSSAIGAVFFPVLAALGVIGAMVTHLTLVIERKD